MFEREMAELGIDLICAYLPQVNQFISNYLQIHNQKFAVEPISPIDNHEPLRPENNLDLIFTRRKTKIVSNNLEFQYDRVVCQIQSD